jgi:hypothetical protein
MRTYDSHEIQTLASIGEFNKSQRIVTPNMHGKPDSTLQRKVEWENVCLN